MNDKNLPRVIWDNRISSYYDIKIRKRKYNRIFKYQNIKFFFDGGFIEKYLRNSVRFWTGFSWFMISSNTGCCCEQDNERSENVLASSRNINFPRHLIHHVGQYASCPRRQTSRPDTSPSIQLLLIGLTPKNIASDTIYEF